MDQQLQVFVKVAEKKNFSRAAEDLLMTQPAVSQYIRTFEENVGTRLLERTSKYVRLNKAGEIVYHHAKEIIGLQTRMQNLVDDLTNKASGPLSIGASFTFGEYVLPRIIAKMHKTFPEIKPTVTIGNTVEIANYVKQHQLDIGIVEGHFHREDKMQVEDFAEDQMHIVASAHHPVAQNNWTTMTDLEKQTWILREKGSGTREATERLLQNHEISPDNVMSFSSTQSIKGAVEAGLGITLLSQWAVRKELSSGDLQIMDVEGLSCTRQFSIVTTSPFQSKALQVFIDLLRNNKELTDFTSES